MDSLVYYKSKLDTITGLSINEKKILITAYAKLFCNEENGAMYLLVHIRLIILMSLSYYRIMGKWSFGGFEHRNVL
jgi:hypothetical protein